MPVYTKAILDEFEPIIPLPFQKERQRLHAQLNAQFKRRQALRQALSQIESAIELIDDNPPLLIKEIKRITRKALAADFDDTIALDTDELESGALYEGITTG